jgi:hypothetical protein
MKHIDGLQVANPWLKRRTLHQHAADELFLRNILWTDEACFTREGVFNVHKSPLREG